MEEILAISPKTNGESIVLWKTIRKDLTGFEDIRIR